MIGSQCFLPYSGLSKNPLMIKITRNNPLVFAKMNNAKIRQNRTSHNKSMRCTFKRRTLILTQILK